MKRFFIANNKINNNFAIIDGEEFFHMTVVLRMREGESVEVCVNDGFIWFGTIKSIQKKQAEVELSYCEQSTSEAKTTVDVFQALCKGEKTDLIVQKCTELGINKLVLFESKFCVAKFGANNERLQKIALQSSKQCGRAVALSVLGGLTFEKMLESLKQYDLVVFANEREKASSLPPLLAFYGKRVGIIIGSEGGFAPEEIEQIENNGAVSISLGKRILRCETAAIALSAIVMHNLGELGGQS